MFANPEKFQRIIINRWNKSNNSSILKISNIEIKPKKIVTLQSIEIDNKRNFENYTSTISKKANDHLNTICRKANFLDKKKANVVKYISSIIRQKGES